MLLEKSRKGPLTARFTNRYIHSRYDPEKEASQLLDNFIAQNDYSNTKTVFVFEPGLGYILDDLKKIHDNSRLIIFFYNSECYKYCKSQGLIDDINSYHPESDMSLDEYLDSVLAGINIRNILFFELPSTASLFADMQIKFQKRILDHISISQGSEMTKNHFALKWILNSFKNYKFHDLSGQISSINSPVILTASGPSLEKNISRIAELKNSYIIAALPSSLAVLKAHGVVPDILFTTDPGYYAREHLRYLNSKTIVVSSVIASLLETDNYCCGINQNSFPENLLFQKGELNNLQEMGTVAATALFYLLKLTKDNIYITGLDFCMDDIKMHAQPHSFTPFILKNESRVNPGYNAFFNRAASMTYSIEKPYRLTKNMNTYTAWFKQQNFENRVYRLRPAAVSLPIAELEYLPFNPAAKTPIHTIRNTEYPTYVERCRRLNNLEQSLRSMIQDFEENDSMNPLLAEFTEEVLPLFKLNPKKDNLKYLSAKSDFLYKIKYLIEKLGGVSHG
jgi:6-hydroxymethylpterin diphosphokinase MptE-like